MANRRVYIETSIVSYLTARPTSDLVAAAWQKATVDWWESQRDRFDLFTSDVSIEEASRGDSTAAASRLSALAGLPLLELTDSAVELAKALVQEGAFPSNAADDALHVAICSVHHIDYLLTWNFRHLDNAEVKPAVRAILLNRGHLMPEICTPQELMGV